MAHQYQRNMLDASMTVDQEYQNLQSKQELTIQDLAIIVENAEKLKAAAIAYAAVKI